VHVRVSGEVLTTAVCVEQGLGESNEELLAARDDLEEARAASESSDADSDSAAPASSQTSRSPEAERLQTEIAKEGNKSKNVPKELPIVNAVKGALGALRLTGSPSPDRNSKSQEKTSPANREATTGGTVTGRVDAAKASRAKAAAPSSSGSAAAGAPAVSIPKRPTVPTTGSTSTGTLEAREAQVSERGAGAKAVKPIQVLSETKPTESEGSATDKGDQKSVKDKSDKGGIERRPDAARAAQGKAGSHTAPPTVEQRAVAAPMSKPPPVPTAPVRSRDPRASGSSASASPAPAEKASEKPSTSAPQESPRASGFATQEAPSAQPVPLKGPTLQDIVNSARQRGAKIFTDYAPRPGTKLRVLMDKSRTVFAHDQNEHHMQLKIGLNKWDQIYNLELKKVTELPGEDDVYAAIVQLPEELFRFDFVIEDFRTGKVCRTFPNQLMCILPLNASKCLQMPGMPHLSIWRVLQGKLGG
jgi:hypothetical protein